MSKTVRVLQVFASLNIGGAECRMMDIYRNLDRTKIQFDFITMTDENQFFEPEIKELGGYIFRVDNPRRTFIIKHIKDLVKIMKTHNYQAVHSHTSYHCGIVSLAARIAGIKYRVAHARTTGSIQKGKIDRLNIQLGRTLVNFFSNKRLCISKDAGEFLYGKRAMRENEIIILPNAIDLSPYENFYGFDKGIEFRIKDHQVIGHIGRFYEMKNHKFLIDIFEKLIENGGKYKLILIGDGLLKDEIEGIVLKKQLVEDVIFTGNRRDIPYLLSLMDVLIMPSFYEGLGGAVIEAQAAGIPCVISSNLPNEIDLGLGLIKRVSLNKSLETWINEVGNVVGHKIFDRERISEVFNEKNYTVEKAIEYLINNIYMIENN